MRIIIWICLQISKKDLITFDKSSNKLLQSVQMKRKQINGYKCVKLAALSAERQGRRKTYGPGETRTHDHAFRRHLLYH